MTDTPDDDGIARVLAMLREPSEDLLRAMQSGGWNADPTGDYWCVNRGQLRGVANYIEQHARSAPSDQAGGLSLLETVAALRAIPVDWGENPIAELEEIRHGPTDEPTRQELIEALADALAPGTTRTLQQHLDARDKARSVLSRARRG